MNKNNVTRLLEVHKIPFTAYELPEEKLGALETARWLKAEPSEVYKTIVVTRERPGKPLLVVIPGPREVDLKQLAAFLGEKKVHLPPQRQAEQLTGLQAGGISPLALLQRGFEVVLDQTALQHELIYISGGQRGLNIRLPVQAFIELTRARLAAVSTSAPS